MGNDDGSGGSNWGDPDHKWPAEEVTEPGEEAGREEEGEKEEEEVGAMSLLNVTDRFSRESKGKMIEIVERKSDEHIRMSTLLEQRRKEQMRKLPKLQANASPTQRDPWKLPSCFTLIKEPSSDSSLKTHSGCWKEKEFTAIRSEGKGSSSSSLPSYRGVKRTLQFYKHDGSKTNWFINEYQLLDPGERHDAGTCERALFLQENVVIRKVFEKCTNRHQAPSAHENLGPTESAAPSGKSEVWQHFTKIYTKDHDVVYAACHCCDRVLKAHSQNGTSHLKRHTDNCSGNNNPSTAADQEILRDLRARLDLYKQNMEGRVDPPELNADIAQRDPWDLQSNPCYFTSSLNRETHHGSWKEIDKELTAIRIDHQLPTPRYVGLRRTLEFHHQDGDRTDWIMLEYHQVDECEPSNLLLQGGFVFRKVFQNYNDAASYALRELERMWDGDDKEDCYNGEREEEVKAGMDTLLRDCLLGEGDKGYQSRPRKRKRTIADVWLHFTKIYTTDPKMVHAVCHYCDRGYSGRSKNGTSHLRRHNTKCSSQHHNGLGGSQNLSQSPPIPLNPLRERINPSRPEWEAEEVLLLLAQIFKIMKEQENTECSEAGNNEDDLGGC